MKTKEFKLDLQRFAEGDEVVAPDIEVITRQVEERVKTEYDKKLAQEKIEREKAEQRTKALELDKMDEKAKADFLAKEKEDNLLKRIAELEAGKKEADEKSKSYEAKIKDVELKENVVKLKTQYPLLAEDLDAVKTWEGLSTFLEMKNSLQKRAEELAKYKDFVRKSGGSAFDESGETSVTEKEKLKSFVEANKKLAIEKLLAR
jgi:hypothetical protein